MIPGFEDFLHRRRHRPAVIASAGGVDADGPGFAIRPGNGATFLDIGAVLAAAVTFLITAAVVYFVFEAGERPASR